MLPAIINVAFNVLYPAAQKRLVEGLERHGFNGEKYFWVDELPAGSPRHHVVPYGFKTWAFAEARRRGHRVVLWCDAALVPIRDVRPVLEHIEKHGHLFMSLGMTCGEWCSDAALPLLGVTREQAWGIPSISGSFMGLDFGHARSREFFRRWHAFSMDGRAFRAPWENEADWAETFSLWVPRRGLVSKDPRVKGHRHDQTCASMIAHRLGMELTQPPEFFCYGSPKEPHDERTVFVNDRETVNTGDVRDNARAWPGSRLAEPNLEVMTRDGQFGEKEKAAVPIVLNVALNAGYPKAQDRLKENLQTCGFKGETYFLKYAYPPDCPPHEVSPYAFKAYAFLEAARRGHKKILWCDSAAYPIRDVSPAWRHLEEHGYLFVALGLPCGEWCSDRALEILGVSREEAMGIPELTGAFMGLNLEQPIAQDFLKRWAAVAMDGAALRGPWEPAAGENMPGPWRMNVSRRGFVSGDARVKGHRHDQCCASIIAHQLGMRLLKMPRFFCYAPLPEPPDPQTIFVSDRGRIAGGVGGAALSF